ncbi:hypothetical protein E4191_07320 [Paracoccus liaowanqingii]|uniref:Uncharacterized protein n=1 Tax=Paracoccus liaowanqingii TaxID=2560053 RepID=A0A4P7HLP3_9RHOB|nr:hypothetical protein E4191_07320 [Paracoccus liaowanqingii]
MPSRPRPGRPRFRSSPSPKPRQPRPPRPTPRMTPRPRPHRPTKRSRFWQDGPDAPASGPFSCAPRMKPQSGRDVGLRSGSSRPYLVKHSCPMLSVGQ